MKGRVLGGVQFEGGAGAMRRCCRRGGAAAVAAIMVGAFSASVGNAAEVAPSEPEVAPGDVPEVAPRDAARPALMPMPVPPEPGTPTASSASDAIELDVSLTGETRAARRIIDEGRTRLEALVLLSAADGVGVGGQLRSGMLGLRATVAYQPLLFLVDADPADKTFGAFEFSNSVQLNLDAMLVSTDTGTGGSLGYRFNDLLGHAISVAYQSRFELWGQHFDLSFPVTYYPGATRRVREQLGIANDYEINFPFGAGLQFGMGVAWVL